MKTQNVIIAFIAFFFFSTVTAFAHMPGQPPYFVINGKYSNLYNPPTGQQLTANSPQDNAPETYVVNQKLNLSIDVNRFPSADPNQVKKTKFYWTYGDGSLADGLTNTHVYTKSGQYILKIMANDGIAPQPQLFESVLITVKDPTSASPQTASKNMLPLIGIGVVVLLGIIIGIFRLIKI